jgi:hypothetical protein
MAQEKRRVLRKQISALLAEGGDGAQRLRHCKLTHAAAQCTLHLPAINITDFYAGIHHATNGGKRTGRRR